ncbi:hypothetical protein ACLX1H_009245 [Fusarium chlamydosporum]
MPRRKKGPGSFHGFARLPLEIQDEIWKLALEIDTPTAHFIDLIIRSPNIQALPTNEADKWWDTVPADVATEDDESRAKPVYPIRKALMRVCRRSRQVVKGISRKEELDDPLSSYVFPASANPPRIRDYHSFHATRYKYSPRPWQKAFTSHDLVIITNPWANYSRPSWHGFKHGDKKHVKCTAVPYLPTDPKWRLPSHTQTYIGGILRIFDELEILYILIHPDIIRKGERLENMDIVPKMKEHLDKYRRTSKETSSKTYQCRDRIYREISDVLLLKLNQLPDLPSMVTELEKIAKKQRKRNGGDKPPLIIRFMTWKHAPG